MSNKIKTYEEFVNEEINLKKALAGAALGVGLAFGNPQDVSAKEPIKTEITQNITQNTDDDYSIVIQVDSTMKKSDIKKSVMGQLYGIQGLRITSNTEDKIVCSIQFSSKPENSNGIAYGNMEISFKDGRYKVDFYNIYFDYMGQQPQTVGQQVGQNVKRQVGGLATSIVTSQIRNPILQNTARQAAGAVLNNTVNQPQQEKDNLTYQQAMTDNVDFATSIDSEMNKIIEKLKSGFSGKQQEEDW